MRDEDKPFVCYRQSKWSFQIAPRNAVGRRSMALWTAAFLAAAAGYVALVLALQAKGVSETTIGLLLIPFLIITAVLVIFMIRWMLARSEIIDTNEIMKIKRAQDSAKKKSGR